MEAIRKLVEQGLQRFATRCFKNVTYDLTELDREMARRRLCEHGGRDGFELGRKILALVDDGKDA